jgi:two-component system OmpR family response regulator
MSNLCILHVDDDQSIRELTALAFDLTGEGEVHSASSGAEALRMLREGLKPDVLLLDVMMPDMDGPTLLGVIRTTPGFARAPAIFMTAQTQDRELGDLLALGAVGVVIKPFDPMSLSEQVRSLLGGTV